MRALVIDDVADLRALLRTILEGFGIDCAEADNGMTAMEILERYGAFDFCTVDVFMPLMDGFGFVEAVRKNPAYKGMKLVMVTTDVEKSSVDRALKLGADEYVMKPYTKDIIESKLKILGLVP